MKYTSINTENLPTMDFFKRIWIYTKEMYPIHKRLTLAALLFISIRIIVMSIQKSSVKVFDIHVIYGVISIFLILFILRLMDELKDVEIDKKLFAHRPIPSGRVSKKDINVTLYLSITLFLCINLWDIVSFIAGFCLLCYTLLMYKYFFIPHILRDNLLLNLSTHNPVVAFIIIYIITISLISCDLEFVTYNLSSFAMLVFMYWGIFFSWEISRKIRSKKDENDYVTYSQIFGINGSVLITIVSQTVTFIIGITLYVLYDYSKAFIIILSVAYMIVLSMNVRFLRQPISAYSNLSKYTENFATLTMLAPIIDYIINIL